ncbi:hypothetical protein [Coleofasciculus sp.]|uniref:hypothetical protein n=1 Tax=Coleofasciculus sp. TaxID=3100458 RepID=UPI003A360A30
MKWLKAALFGALGGLAMFILLQIAITMGMAPINVPPSAAFLKSIGLPPEPLALIVHFGYAMVGSMILIAIFGNRTNVTKGIGLALVLWLILMLVFSPIIGWGFFGATGAKQQLSPPLQIGSPGMYIIATLVLHIIYGASIGWLDRHWIDWGWESQESHESQNQLT